MSSTNAQITMPAIELGPDLPDESSLTLDNVREQVKWRIRTDDAFSDALFSEAIQVLLADDMATGKTVLFDYIEATIGFDELARQSGIPLDLLLQMFGPLGDPRAADLFRVISLLQQHKGIQFEVSTAA